MKWTKKLLDGQTILGEEEDSKFSSDELLTSTTLEYQNVTVNLSSKIPFECKARKRHTASQAGHDHLGYTIEYTFNTDKTVEVKVTSVTSFQVFLFVKEHEYTTKKRPNILKVKKNKKLEVKFDGNRIQSIKAA